MMTDQLLAEIEQFKHYPRWSVKFPACEEAHYHDGILVFSYNRVIVTATPVLTNPKYLKSDSTIN